MKMQKRRGSLPLPITMLDVDKASKGRSSQGRSRYPSRASRVTSISVFKIFLLVACGVTALLIISSTRKKRKNSVSHTIGILDHELALQHGRDAIQNVIQDVKNQREAILQHGKILLEKGIQHHTATLHNFTSLSDIYPHTELIALYFGASWCPSCRAFTNVLDDAFTLDTSAGKDRIFSRSDSKGKKDLAIVHVSSDTTEEEMKAFLRQNWIAVPYEHPDRVSLKRFFRVCAEKEQSELGIHRQYEIPSLIIIDSVTQSLVTPNGVHDVQSYGVDAIEMWLKLRNVVSSMHDKYLKDS